MRKIAYKYIGKGAWIPNVPARDLTLEEVMRYGGAGRIEAAGLWVKVEEPEPVKKTRKTARKAKKEGA